MVRPEHQSEFHRLTHFDPRLAARSWLLMEDARDMLIAGLVPPGADRSELFRARVLVSACIMVVDTAITTWIETGTREDLAVILAQGAEHLRQGFTASTASA
jgi:hypothetical protein